MFDPVNNFETNTASFRRAGQRSTAPRPEMAKRVMDVEDVVSWAFREELPKGEGSGSGSYGPAPYVSPLARMVAIGVSVDNWNREPGFPSAMGTPHPDALLVARAIAQVQDETGQTIGCLDGELNLGLAQLGADEPAAVRRALAALPSIVARCAKLRSRPFWGELPVPRALKHPAQGRPQVVRWEPVFSKTITGDQVDHEALVPVEVRKKGEYPFGSFCPVSYSPSPQSVAEERAEYLVWWGTLYAIATELSGKLATIAILPPFAPQRPWLGEEEAQKPPRLFENVTSRVYDGEARQAAAAHRMLGLRRPSSTRRGDRRGAPVRPAIAPAKRACGVV